MSNDLVKYTEHMVGSLYTLPFLFLLPVSGDLPVARAAILKHVLRSMHRMMQSSGTAEGLRGLIDMSILQSIKKIIKYRGLFGPTVVPLGMSLSLQSDKCVNEFNSY
jgi:hypothetical protein